VLRIFIEENRLKILNGFGPEFQTVTRYAGERWSQTGAGILCGVTDVFQDAGIITIGVSTSFSESQLSTALPLCSIGHSECSPTGTMTASRDSHTVERTVRNGINCKSA
jgi:hypothetical protein